MLEIDSLHHGPDAILTADKPQSTTLLSQFKGNGRYGYLKRRRLVFYVKRRAVLSFVLAPVVEAPYQIHPIECRASPAAKSNGICVAFV
jgi:hypothetical protein